MHTGAQGGRRGRNPRSSPKKRVLSAAENEKAQRAPSNAHSRVIALRSDPFWPPIKDAAKEKGVIEKKGRGAWERWLMKEAQATTFVMAPADIELRLCEVYRLCFEKSRRKDISILNDFVAHHPALLFRCAWVEQLVRDHAFVRHFNPQARRILQALGSGLRRAGSERDISRLYLPSKIVAAREVQKKLAQELSNFFANIDAHNADPTWLAEELGRKVEETIREYPGVASAKTKLRVFLEKDQAYKASILIAAKTFHVRERDLQESS
jgi:hypothetical protein